MELLLVFLFSSLIASFLNVVAYRLPRQESVAYPPSRCPHCGVFIRWYHNIPILSYLVLRGRCAYCGHSISPRYLAVEILYPLVNTYLFWRIGELSPMFIALCIFTAFLTVTALIDLETMEVYALTTLFPGVIFLLFHAVVGTANFWLYLVGGFVGLSLPYVINFVWRKIRGSDGIGYGDGFILFMIGSMLGIFGVVLSLLMGCILALPVGIYLYIARGGSFPFPFGPFICSGSVLYLLVGDVIFKIYLRLLGFDYSVAKKFYLLAG
ncbi:MAG: prepilin peptidase [Thermoproteota archaeon]